VFGILFITASMSIFVVVNLPANLCFTSLNEEKDWVSVTAAQCNGTCARMGRACTVTSCSEFVNNALLQNKTIHSIVRLKSTTQTLHCFASTVLPLFTTPPPLFTHVCVRVVHMRILACPNKLHFEH